MKKAAKPESKQVVKASRDISRMPIRRLALDAIEAESRVTMSKRDVDVPIKAGEMPFSPNEALQRALSAAAKMVRVV